MNADRWHTQKIQTVTQKRPTMQDRPAFGRMSDVWSQIHLLVGRWESSGSSCTSFIGSPALTYLLTAYLHTIPRKFQTQTSLNHQTCLFVESNFLKKLWNSGDWPDEVVTDSVSVTVSMYVLRYVRTTSLLTSRRTTVFTLMSAVTTTYFWYGHIDPSLIMPRTHLLLRTHSGDKWQLLYQNNKHLLLWISMNKNNVSSSSSLSSSSAIKSNISSAFKMIACHDVTYYRSFQTQICPLDHHK